VKDTPDEISRGVLIDNASFTFLDFPRFPLGFNGTFLRKNFMPECVKFIAYETFAITKLSYQDFYPGNELWAHRERFY